MEHSRIGVKVTRNAYHAVWSPQYRNPILAGETPGRLRGILREIVGQKGFEFLALPRR